MSWLQDPVAAAMLLPAFAVPLFVFVSAFLEYVFPPYWGDTFMLLGFFLAGQGAASPSMVFVGAFVGSVLGSVVAFLLGRRYGMGVIRWIGRRRRRSTGRQRTQELFQRFGEPVLAINRFMPVIRGFMLYGAGALGLRFGPSMLYCTLSNLAFVTALMSVGLLTAGSWEEIVSSVRIYNQWLGVAAALAAAVWFAVLWMRSRRPAA